MGRKRKRGRKRKKVFEYAALNAKIYTETEVEMKRRESLEEIVKVETITASITTVGASTSLVTPRIILWLLWWLSPRTLFTPLISL
jgi:hypothetical protein